MDDAVRLARDLIRVDTTNPPGRETAAAIVLRDYLEAAGVACELVARDPDRANLIARLPGTGGGPSLALVGHTDVVYADQGAWTREPFGGEVADGHLWGRGALDMKGHVAANAVALATLARSGRPLRGDVVLIAAADEEDGAADVGLAWLLRERPDLRTDFALNEGGGFRLSLADGRALYALGCAEKATMPMRVVVHGVAGHASIPSSGDNALVKLAPVLERLAAFAPEIRIEPEVAAILDVLAPGGSLAERIDRARALHPVLDEDLPALVGSTAVPTMASASRKRNVVPARAEVVCDCRVLPGTTPAQLEAELRRALDGLAVTIEPVEEPAGGSRSAIGTPLHHAIGRALAALEPGAVLVPWILAGFTDSHYLRAAGGTVAYGFFPGRFTDPDLLATVHAADERIDVRDIADAAAFYEAVARDLCG